MTAPRVLGIDQSLTSTGLALIHGDGQVEVARIRPGPLRGHERLNSILGSVSVAAAHEGVDLAVVEGLSYGAKGNTLLDLAGLQHLIRHLLWTMSIPYAVVAPTVRAKYATGRGGATKDEVMAAVIRRWPHLEITGNDVADAVTLAAMGRHHLGCPLGEMPRYAADVLTARHTDKKRRGQPVIAWPELGARVTAVR